MISTFYEVMCRKHFILKMEHVLEDEYILFCSNGVIE